MFLKKEVCQHPYQQTSKAFNKCYSLILIEQLQSNLKPNLMMKIYQPFLYSMLKKDHYLGIYSATASCAEEA